MLSGCLSLANLVYDPRKQREFVNLRFPVLRDRIFVSDGIFHQFYFMDNEEDTEPRKFFCFDGCMIKMEDNVLEVEVGYFAVHLFNPWTWDSLIFCMQARSLPSCPLIVLADHFQRTPSFDSSAASSVPRHALPCSPFRRIPTA